MSPYIDPAKRDRARAHANNAGELNFAFTALIVDYLNRKGLSYQHLNDCIGALEGCKLELYRRLAAPYEDEKAMTNGDVYP